MKYAASILFFIVIMPFICTASDVNINIGVAPPPVPAPEVAVAETPQFEEFAAPPDVVAVPSGTATVYMVPNAVGVYFYNGYWFRSYDRYWYRSTFYNGPWNFVEAAIVPRFIVDVPPEYVYVLPPHYFRIHYGEFHSHWRDWDRSHHWDRYDWYRNERREDIRRDRFRHLAEERKHHPEWHGRDHGRGPGGRGPGGRGPEGRDHRRGPDMKGPGGRGPEGKDHRRGTDMKGLGGRGPDMKGPGGRGPGDKGPGGRGPGDKGSGGRGPDMKGSGGRGPVDRGPGSKGSDVKGGNKPRDSKEHQQ